MPSASFSVSRAPMAPTIVTSRPSRIQTVPSPSTTSQCHELHGSRSILAGMRVRIVCTAPVYPEREGKTLLRRPLMPVWGRPDPVPLPRQPSVPVEVCGAPTGFDSGDPRWRR